MSGQSLAEPQMNATPLIDVLLVLLVMIIFTLPVATHAVKLNLPQQVDRLPSAQLPITVHIDFDGQLHWNGRPAPDLEWLERKLHEARAAGSGTRVKVIPDKRVLYEVVAKVLAAAQRARISALEVAPIQSD
jgi:biopolymer transport protein ExbD